MPRTTAHCSTFTRMAALAMFMIPLPALATTAAPTLDSGDTAWMLTSSLLVLLMTMPGLALFYGGLVRVEERAVGADAVLRHRLDGDACSGWSTATAWRSARRAWRPGRST